jgi:DNA-binding CsgD family transcriptional regulator
LDRREIKIISDREYQVAELIAWGASDKEVAQELNISPDTAKTHRRNILKKIEGHNTADITRWFFIRKCKMIFDKNPRKVDHIKEIQNVINSREALRKMFK